MLTPPNDADRPQYPLLIYRLRVKASTLFNNTNRSFITVEAKRPVESCPNQITNGMLSGKITWLFYDPVAFPCPSPFSSILFCSNRVDEQTDGRTLVVNRNITQEYFAQCTMYSLHMLQQVEVIGCTKGFIYDCIVRIVLLFSIQTQKTKN